jgi:hypothetical protein
MYSINCFSFELLFYRIGVYLYVYTSTETVRVTQIGYLTLPAWIGNEFTKVVPEFTIKLIMKFHGYAWKIINNSHYLIPLEWKYNTLIISYSIQQYIRTVEKSNSLLLNLSVYGKNAFVAGCVCILFPSCSNFTGYARKGCNWISSKSTPYCTVRKSCCRRCLTSDGWWTILYDMQHILLIPHIASCTANQRIRHENDYLSDIYHFNHEFLRLSPIRKSMLLYLLWSRDSVVSTATSYGLGDRGIGVQVPVE